MQSLTNAVIAALLAVSTVVVAVRLTTAPHAVPATPQVAVVPQTAPPIQAKAQASPPHRVPSTASRCAGTAAKGRSVPADAACPKTHDVAKENPAEPITTPPPTSDLVAIPSPEGHENDSDVLGSAEPFLVEGPAVTAPEPRARMSDETDRLTVRHLFDAVAYLKSLEGDGPVHRQAPETAVERSGRAGGEGDR